MRAISYSGPGGPDVLELVERPVPEPGPGEVRVRVAFSGVNPTDWKTRSSAEPGPDGQIPNQDGAGTVEAVGEGVDEMTTWRETTTVYHEGVPGHHLQVGQLVYNSALLNRWQRLLSMCSAHAEGWALYAERLMSELGFLDDPAERLGMLDAQELRAARVVLDIGVHLDLPIPAGWAEGDRWTYDVAAAFLREHVSMEEQMRTDELHRYLGWPGQAPVYKVGERVFLAGREQAKARAGADFDLKAWHQAVLDLGDLGLDPLAQELARL